jgi:hypothetical protein
MSERRFDVTSRQWPFRMPRFLIGAPDAVGKRLGLSQRFRPFPEPIEAFEQLRM